MNEYDLIRAGGEIGAALSGRKIGKIFALGPLSFAVDLYPHEGRYLYINIDSGKSAAAYLIRRKLKELERQSVHPSPFVIDLRKRIFGLTLTHVATIPAQRVLRMDLDGDDQSCSFCAILGPRPNLLLVDSNGIIVAAARHRKEKGQEVGGPYIEPAEVLPSGGEPMETGGRSLSDQLDEAAQQDELDSSFDIRSAEARRKIESEIRKKEKLLQNLEGDLVKHGDPDEWKRWGDLLLANIGSIRFEGDTAIVIDYYDEATPEVRIPLEPHSTPAETAESYFTRYTKARNAKAAVAERQLLVRTEIEDLRARKLELENAISVRDEAAVAKFLPKPKSVTKPQKGDRKPAQEIRGVRRFISTDGFEILVGKKAIDNDNLTFRIAKSLDLWFHAEDYPGSHVIIRNSGRKEIPMKTLLEASRLAAFYSDAREMPKVAVRYTPRKFINKPKRAAPGLVSLSSFKTLLVEPKIDDIAKAE